MTFDRFSAAMYTDGDFAMAQYLPYTLVPFYALFRERGGGKVERDQTDWDVSRLLFLHLFERGCALTVLWML
jgi:hypothetical protein